VSSKHDGATEKDDRFKEQIKVANRELSRLLDAYQSGALELPELQKRRQLVHDKIELLNREQELVRKMVAENKKETDIKASLGEFAALVSGSLKRISFENKQKLLRIVLDKVVVKDWRVDVYYTIPLPKPTPTPEEKVSTKFDLRSTCATSCRALDYADVVDRTLHLRPPNRQRAPCAIGIIRVSSPVGVLAGKGGRHAGSGHAVSVPVGGGSAAGTARRCVRGACSCSGVRASHNPITVTVDSGVRAVAGPAPRSSSGSR
jgi:hypothetical protein